MERQPRGREAVNDAMPLLKRARSVTMLAINPQQGAGDRDENSSANIALHLARHGLKAEAAYLCQATSPKARHCCRMPRISAPT